MRTWLLVLAAGCTDYNIQTEVPVSGGDDTDEVAAAAGDIVVTPASLSWVLSGEPESQEVSVENAGDAPLTVSSWLDGGGAFVLDEAWSDRALAPGEQAVLLVWAQAVGAGTLELRSDDPDEPVVEVLLGATEAAVENTPPGPPTVAITPSAPAEEDALLCEVVEAPADPDGDAVSLRFDWTVDGVPWAGATGSTAESGDTIDRADTREGQVWTCTVTPSDGTEDGEPGSDTVTIGGSLLTPCLVAWYPLDGDAADLIGGNDGVVMGGAGAAADRHGGSDALGFDGRDDYVEVSHAAAVTIGEDATISLWFRAEPHADVASQMIIDKTAASDYSLDLLDGGSLRWRERADGAFQGIEDSSDWLDGNWHHVAIRKEGSARELLVDGARVGTMDVGSAVDSSANPLIIGAGGTPYTNDDYQLLGAVDDLRFYDCAVGDDVLDALLAE